MLSRLRKQGSNTAALAWADGAIIQHNLSGFTRDLLYFVATNTCFRLWRRFFMHIAGISKALGCCRSSVEKALKTLRDLKLIAYDGQKHVGKRRPVAVYRLSGTPECPLPEWVVEAREAEREEELSKIPEWDAEEALTCAFTYRTEQSEAAVTDSSSETPSEDPSQEETGDIYPPALPVKTGPEAGPQPMGSVTGVRHQEASLSWMDSWGTETQKQGWVRRMARSTAKRLLGGVVPPRVGHYRNGPEEGSPGVRRVNEPLASGTKIPVTYSPRTTEGTSMNHSTSSDTAEALFAIPLAPQPAKPNPMLEFDTFWTYYPRKTGKGAARKAFLAALSKTTALTIIEAVSAYALNCQAIGKEKQFIPHPSTWLNQERWDDEPEEAPQVRSRVQDAFRQNMELVNYYRQQEALTGGAEQKAIGW